MNSSDLIDKLGGPKALADEFRITEAAVCHWRKRGMPRYRREYLELKHKKLLKKLQGKQS
jgi:hypothetical protein